ncbi:MAG: hypothetical protein J6A05_08330, partial [Oscillospiraceae bacterium]|nr:hypothetical protein [Oscillospiraceae bacterium]
MFLRLPMVLSFSTLRNTAMLESLTYRSFNVFILKSSFCGDIPRNIDTKPKNKKRPEVLSDLGTIFTVIPPVFTHAAAA